ncbi:arylsulfatase [Saccharicrinis aurantiacus]|uniref:arylsulfatase n=1 Tax=Saccharicrinis aurantiacus TaxID=1849719 RepID=UPI0008392653|nr:arylsulfatase [Saccharicrinis aurantiacus]
MKRVLYLMIFLGFFGSTFSQKGDKPNVILILTDDQGIGDIGCHGNAYIQTPNLDAFYKQSVRMTDFHVSPLCAPTRGAIMTGRYPINNGVWATYKGRDALFDGAPTMADMFKQNGYTTAMFGKWHLGDNYPVRATDCGFDHAVFHKAGGVGELSDYWGNSYFDDTYYVNNKPQQFEGYCTDVWFNETIKFIKENKNKPFFIYLPTNAPHSPLIVDEKYAAPYRSEVGKNIYSAEFYGMITNIDENFGKLEEFLKEMDLADNTILIFTTDNGSGNGVSKDGKIGYNMGFSGKKGSKLDGGHRVPFFIRWKDGKIKGGKDIRELTAHVDLIPTLAGLCKLKVPKTMELDGLDFSPLLRKESENLQPRNVYVHHRQDWRPPMDIEQTCIMQDDWRLLNGKQLYNIKDDRKQKNNVANEQRELVMQMLNANQEFLAKAKENTEYNEFTCNLIGYPAQEEVTLSIQHAIGEDGGIWKAEQVCAGKRNKNNTHAIKVERDGKYQIECCRWPKECSGPVWGIPSENPKGMYTYQTIHPEKVRIRVANKILEKAITEKDEAVTFTVDLEKGKTLLVNDFIEGKQNYGVYYTYIKYLGSNNL